METVLPPDFSTEHHSKFPDRTAISGNSCVVVRSAGRQEKKIAEFLRARLMAMAVGTLTITQGVNLAAAAGPRHGILLSACMVKTPRLEAGVRRSCLIVNFGELQPPALPFLLQQHPWRNSSSSQLVEVERLRWLSSRIQRRNRTSTGRRIGQICPSCFNGTTGNMSDAMIVELPCLPFSPVEVFVPSSTKILHLYEARFLALLDEVMGKYNNLFAHIIIEPMAPGRSDDDGKGTTSFLATYGCLARVENVKRLDIGAAVTIRGIGRIKLIGLTQLEPFLKSTIVSLKDEAPSDEEAVASALNELQSTLNNVQELQIKLKVKNRPALDDLDPIFQAEASGDEPLQTPLEKALQWAKKGEPDNIAEAYVPSREERLSFAALQPVAGASAGEQQRLLQERLYAMEAMDTMQRLKRVTPYAEQTLANLAAKVALQSLKF